MSQALDFAGVRAYTAKLNQAYMAKIVAFSILLVLVYQFDDVLRACYFAYRRLRHKKFKQFILDSDHYVGMALALIGMPLALNYLFVSEKPLAFNLALIAGLYLLFVILTAGVNIFQKRLKQTQVSGNVSAIAGAAYATAGLFYPILRTVPWHTGRGSRELAKLAFLLSLPAVLGLIFKTYFDQYSYETEFTRYMDALIVVMVGGLFINIMVRVLGRYFHRHNLSMLSYFRIVVGIGIALLLMK